VAENWKDVPLDAKMFLNVEEDSLTTAVASIENCFQNEAKGISRFPGMDVFSTLGDNGRVYLHSYEGTMIVATSQGQVYRVGSSGTVTNVTDAPVQGGNRVMFDNDTEGTLMAAGGPIIYLGGEKTEVLSEDAPDSTHVAFIDGYVAAPEPNSQRWFHSASGARTNWPAANLFTAETKPDDVDALIITPHREILVAGEESIEQFERIAAGAVPFFRRWTIGEGSYLPYCIVAATQGTYIINPRKEFVRISGQTSKPNLDIQAYLQTIDSWEDAWAQELHIRGRQFIVLQFPKATNKYTTEGVTLLWDLRQEHWSFLYGWDSDNSLPARWPGWSVMELWDRYFVGGEGKVYELKRDTLTNDGLTQRVLFRTAHLDVWGEVEVKDFRVRVKRGTTNTNSNAPIMQVRVRRDLEKWSRWKNINMGVDGDTNPWKRLGGYGIASTWQFEFLITDAVDFELVKAEVLLEAQG
jgi:hypothetical protein